MTSKEWSKLCADISYWCARHEGIILAMITVTIVGFFVIGAMLDIHTSLSAMVWVPISLFSPSVLVGLVVGLNSLVVHARHYRKRIPRVNREEILQERIRELERETGVNV